MLAEPQGAVTLAAVPAEAMALAAVSSEVVAYAAEPPEAAVLVSSPCMVVAPKNVLSACYVVVKETINELNLSPDVTTVEPPEVAASAAEPPELSVVSSCQSLSCPSMAMEAVDDSSSCPVAAIKAICEPWLRPELTTEVINEPPFAHATAYQLLTCPESAEEAGCVFPVPSVTAEGVMGELPDCYVAPLGAACELLPPPVINTEIINAPQSCPVYLITTMKSSNEPSVCSVIPVIVKKNNSKQSVRPRPVKELSLSVLPVSVTNLSTPASVYDTIDCKLPVSLVSVNVVSVCSVSNYEPECEMSISPVSVNTPGFDLSAGPLLSSMLNSELSVCPVPVHESNLELSVRNAEFDQSISPYLPKNLFMSYLPVQFPSTSLTLNHVTVKFLIMCMNSQPRKLLMNFLYSLPRPLKP